MSLLRKAITGVADNRKVRNLFEHNTHARSLVQRFVAGDSLEDGIRVAKDFQARGIMVTLDLLGENVNADAAAAAGADTFVTILRRMKDEGLDPNISVKLTMLGMDLGDAVAEANMVTILTAARDVSGFVRIDMEGSLYTERTVRMFNRLHDQYPDNVGLVIQTYLRRSPEDVVNLINRSARVRLVKGAYLEPESVAIGTKANNQQYRMLMHHLMDKGNYPAIATHDPAIIADAIAYARQATIPPDRFEFQMLYGVRQDEQDRLARAGYNMRVYVPFGEDWYSYYTRRIAERPANAFFVLRQLLDR